MQNIPYFVLFSMYSSGSGVIKPCDLARCERLALVWYGRCAVNLCLTPVAAVQVPGDIELRVMLIGVFWNLRWVGGHVENMLRAC